MSNISDSFPLSLIVGGKRGKRNDQIGCKTRNVKGGARRNFVWIFEQPERQPGGQRHDQQQQGNTATGAVATERVERGEEGRGHEGPGRGREYAVAIAAADGEPHLEKTPGYGRPGPA